MLVFGVVLLLVGLLLAIVACTLYVVRGFQQSLLWGILNVLLPGGVLIFTILHWTKARTAFVTAIIAVAICAIGAGCILQTQGWSLSNGFATQLVRPDKARENLTDEVNVLRDDIAHERPQVDAFTTALTAEFQALNEKRAQLSSQDPQAVAEFNRDAAEYKARTAKLAAARDALTAKEKKLEELLAKRAKLTAPSPVTSTGAAAAH